MKEHSLHSVNELLEKYRSGVITSEEYACLLEEMNATSDFELREILRVEWDAFMEDDKLPEEKIVAMYDKGIKPHLAPARRSWFKRYWLQVAASVLILLLGGVTTRFYMERQEVQRLADCPITICSGESGSSNVTLPDGTKVRLNARSSLSYKQNFGRKDRRVNLSGEGYFEVQRDENKQFVVSTEVMDIAVLGTVFNVYAYENKDFVEMSLVNGHVRVTPFNNPNKVIDVRPNEKVVYNRATGEMTLKRTNNEMETAWLSNELVFRHEKLGDVFSCLERKYGVRFSIDNSKLLQDIYTGTFTDETIENVLGILRIHYKFDYEIKEGTVYVKTVN